MRLHTGDVVRIRDQRWRVAGESTFIAVSIIEVDGCDAGNRGIRTRFLRPFEAVGSETPPAPVPRFVTMPRWRRAARSVLAGALPRWSSLRAAAGANFIVLPFQLEPAMAVARGDACRVLIADEVGLGKTVQAGLIVAETLVRSPDARVLIVAPAGLREQWRDELQLRFRLSAEVLDAQSIARIADELVPDVNPWSIHSPAITSIDFIKRPEVMRSLETLTWDVLVFDEAHALTGHSDRAAAAAALGRRARVVVMLTATPHSGNEEGFSRLSTVGDIGDAFPLLTFRRTRADVGLPQSRRSTILKVRPTSAESAMHHALNDYLRRLIDETRLRGTGTSLLSSILLRRACSSAASLGRSIERRMALLLDDDMRARDQLTLPFVAADSDDEPEFELGVAGLRDVDEERRWLQHLSELAKFATVGESKVSALRRLLRRVHEPAIVFTEYRDTLQHLRARLDAFAPLTLHGGLTSRDRGGVIRQFNDGQMPLLLATDAASEGLNLHRRCRFVVSLDVPWTPLRLEQRVGRVDRIGQAGRVHALNLVAVGTNDEFMARQLRERVERIQAALNRPMNERGSRDTAEAEAVRVIAARRLSPAPPVQVQPRSALVTSARRPHRRALDLRAFQLSFVDGRGHVEFETIAGVLAEGDLLDLDRSADLAAALHQERVLASVMADIAPWLELSRNREAAMSRALRESHARLSAGLLQPGLFDRRAERAAAAQAACMDEAIERSRTRLDALERLQRLRCGDRLLMFGIRFRP
jgi:superfamily II DNA or RNA helicase